MNQATSSSRLQVVKMEPSSFPEGLDGETSTIDKEIKVTLTIVDCPQGTVPIRRTYKEDLVRAKSFMEAYSNSSIHPLTKDSPGKHFAVVESLDKVPTKFHGIQGYVSVFNLSVGAYQTTSSQVWFETGYGNSLNSLQAGWMVIFHNPYIRVVSI
ncbi:hypothetical protein IFM89_039480 [Coptis chinensis]|uniref:Neprosin PEP catalytic domain-containing protein n=1 Tax=Coptis chinensis TaxID=261450 RepID=A0A835IHJ6_9MAGN|nr:hypothetical protein IFM89_039480 [Coptis chinensis]